jgi:D-galactarolactone cycloisomerase
MITSTIDRVEAYPLRFSLGDKGYGSSRGIVQARETTLVKVVTNDGVVGWGESFGPTTALVPLVNELAADLVGKAVDAPGAFASATMQRHYHRGGGLNTAAISGIEIALWDVLGRTLDVSVATLLGGRARESVTPYASTGYVRADRDLGKFAAGLEKDSAGLKAAKIKCGLGKSEDRARAEVAREILGPSGFLMVDFNGNYSADQAFASIMTLRDLDIAWVEEPLAPEDISGLGLLRSLGVPLATGEALYGRSSFRSLATERLVDYLQPDVTKVGGLLEAKNVSELARAWGLRFSPHVWGGGIALAATLQLLASVPDYPHTAVVPEPLWLEFDRGENALRQELLTAAFRPVKGEMPIPNGPGLGVEVDESALEFLRADR